MSGTTAPGISPTIRDYIFEPFVSYGEAEGSGLWLTIAKKIVEDHGGKIYFDGRVEMGTLFKITIPFATDGGAIPRLSVVPTERIDRWINDISNSE